MKVICPALASMLVNEYDRCAVPGSQITTDYTDYTDTFTIIKPASVKLFDGVTHPHLCNPCNP